MNYDEHDEFRGGGGPGKILPRSNPALLGLFLAAPPGICWKVAWNMLFLQWKVENAGKSTRKISLKVDDLSLEVYFALCGCGFPSR